MRYLLFTLLFLSAHICRSQPYKYLVMEGGGIRGITYAGALEVLEEKKILGGIERVAGTSVGALVAGLVATGYTPEEMKGILKELKLQHFNDGHWIFIGGMRRMKNNYGWYRGEALEEWIGKLIAAKTGNADITLKELHALSQRDKKFKDLYAVATHLTKQRPEILYYGTYPDMPVKTAIRASISIPLYFGALFVDSTGKAFRKQDVKNSRQVFVDGGIVANYPLAIFDTGRINMHTIGLKLERPEQIDYYNTSAGIAPYEIDNFRSYLGALYNITIEQLNKPNAFEEERRRTIYISTGNISPRIRKITDEQKILLYKNGKEAAEKFFSDN